MYRLPDLTSLQSVLHAAIASEGGACGNVQVHDTKRQTLLIVVHSGFAPSFLTYFAEVTAGDGSACGHAMADRRRIFVRDVMEDPGFVAHRPIMEDARVRSVISTPLLHDSGALLGVLSVHFPDPRPADTKRPAVLGSLAHVAARVMECDQLRAQLQHRARERGTPMPILPAHSHHAAQAVRELLRVLGDRGPEAPLAEAAIREMDNLLPELRRLAVRW